MTEQPAVTLIEAPEGSRSSIPQTLYRRFTSRDDAENFVRSGEIRFRSLSHYRAIEADRARWDAHEGTAYIADATGITIEFAPLGTADFGTPLQMVGPLRRSLAAAERYFVSCYSFRKNGAQKKFGPWLVRIHRARPLLRGLAAGMVGSSALFWGRVQYFDPANYGHLIRADKLWLSKPIHLRQEHEFRILFRLDGHFPGGAEGARGRVVVGDISTFADVVYDP